MRRGRANPCRDRRRRHSHLSFSDETPQNDYSAHSSVKVPSVVRDFDRVSKNHLLELNFACARITIMFDFSKYFKFQVQPSSVSFYPVQAPKKIYFGA